MRNIKKIMALTLSYLILITIMPTSIFTAKATDNIPKFLKNSEVYLLDAALYKDKVLGYYYNQNSEANFSIFEKGNEDTLLTAAKLNGYTYGGIFNTYNEIVPFYLGGYNQDTFESFYDTFYFNFNDNSFTKKDLDENLYSKYTDVEFKDEAIKLINEKYNTNFTNDEISGYALKANGSNIITFEYGQDYHNSFNGIVGPDFAFVSKKYDENFFLLNNLSETNTLSVIEYTYEGDTKNHIIHTIVNDKIINTATLCEENIYISEFGDNINDNGTIYTTTYTDSTKLAVFTSSNGEYKKYKEFPISSGLFTDAKGGIWTIIDQNNKRYIAKVTKDELIKKYEISKFSAYTGLYIYDENNMVVTSAEGSIFINNTPTTPPDNGNQGGETTPPDNRRTRWRNNYSR